MDAMHFFPLDARRRRCRGISLVESMVAIAVLVVVATLAVPSLAGFVEARRLDAVATELAADVQLARTEATARNRALRLSVHASGPASCWILHTGAAADCRCGAADRAVCTGGAFALKTVTLDGTDRLRVDANIASMLFDPLHGTATPSGTLRVADARGRSVQHVVNAMGRTRSCSPLAALPGWRAC